VTGWILVVWIYAVTSSDEELKRVLSFFHLEHDDDLKPSLRVASLSFNPKYETLYNRIPDERHDSTEGRGGGNLKIAIKKGASDWNRGSSSIARRGHEDLVEFFVTVVFPFPGEPSPHPSTRSDGIIQNEHKEVVDFSSRRELVCNGNRRPFGTRQVSYSKRCQRTGMDVGRCDQEQSPRNSRLLEFVVITSTEVKLTEFYHRYLDDILHFLTPFVVSFALLTLKVRLSQPL
jgi:hypothetical protein